jgi:radical SAM superfamily enzyme with C-terminal helix-hairpin-helix motif
MGGKLLCSHPNCGKVALIILMEDTQGCYKVNDYICADCLSPMVLELAGEKKKRKKKKEVVDAEFYHKGAKYKMKKRRVQCFRSLLSKLLLLCGIDSTEN